MTLSLLDRGSRGEKHRCSYFINYGTCTLYFGCDFSFTLVQCLMFLHFNLYLVKHDMTAGISSFIILRPRYFVSLVRTIVQYSLTILRTPIYRFSRSNSASVNSNVFFRLLPLGVATADLQSSVSPYSLYPYLSL